jgi:hypothetical protein
LYNLAADLAERVNLYVEQRNLVCTLSQALARARCEATASKGVLRTFALSE